MATQSSEPLQLLQSVTVLPRDDELFEISSPQSLRPAKIAKPNLEVVKLGRRFDICCLNRTV